MVPPNPLELRPVQILLVDDDLADIKLMKRAMENWRVANQVHVVRDGIEAMQFLRCEGQFSDASRPDLILLDLNMPRKDGRETLHDIKNDSELKTIPVIIMTTSHNEQDVLSSYMEQANSFITKPVELDQFREVVAAVMDYWFLIVQIPSRHDSAD